MRTRTVVFLIESPFNRRDFKRYGIELLERQYRLDVQVWDCTPFLHPRVAREVGVPDPIEYPRHHSFLTERDLLQWIGTLKRPAFVVCLIGYTVESLVIYRALSRQRIPYAVMVANALPRMPRLQTTRSLIRTLRRTALWQRLRGLSLRLPPALLGIRPATAILAGGRDSLHYRYPTGLSTRVVWAHALDYDVYLEECEEHHEGGRAHVVFLDEYTPFHPDYVHLGISPPVTADIYYRGLVSFFERVERDLQTRVVIAAHPRAVYEEGSRLFGTRRVVQGQTGLLVRQASAVLAHSSTSLNFGVLFRKPVVFLTSNELESGSMGQGIRMMASHLNKVPINVDGATAIDWGRQLQVDEVAYAEYQRAYIKRPGSLEMPFWAIFAEFLRSL